MKIKKMTKWFDQLEDRVRAVLSRHPVVYAMIGSVGIILLWRGIWGMADAYEMSYGMSIVVGTLILLLTGLFVSFFVGEQIIISGINEEKRIDEATEEEIRFQSIGRIQMQWKLEGMLKKLDRRLERLENKFGTMSADHNGAAAHASQVHEEKSTK